MKKPIILLALSSCLILFHNNAETRLYGLTNGDRQITIVNECPFEVWWAFTGGFVADGPECPSGSALNPENGLCFWAVPDDKGVEVNLKSGDSSTFTVGVQAGNDIIWSGNLGARMGCNPDGSNCEIGFCELDSNDNRGFCEPGIGPLSPLTLIEFTFQKRNLDFYDISLIDGFNLSATMVPVFNGDEITPDNSDYSTYVTELYRCQAPGYTEGQGSLSGSSWAFQPPDNIPVKATSANFVWVAEGGSDNCNADSDCASGEVCGYRKDGTKLTKGCGEFLTFLTTHTLCTYAENPENAAILEPFQCDVPLPGYPNYEDGTRPTFSDLYGCVPFIDNGDASSDKTFLDSCFQQGANDKCCGCTGWDNLAMSVPAPPGDFGVCKNNASGNGLWRATVLPVLQWIKEGCPTCYNYQFDDPTSTFTCYVDSGKGTDPESNNINTVDYKITFCPGGTMLAKGEPEVIPPVAGNGGTGGEDGTDESSALQQCIMNCNCPVECL